MDDQISLDSNYETSIIKPALSDQDCSNKESRNNETNQSSSSSPRTKKEGSSDEEEE